MKREYKVTKGVFGRYVDNVNVLYRTGDTIRLTDEEARALGSRVQPIVAPSGDTSNTDTTKVLDDAIHAAQEADATIKDSTRAIEDAIAEDTDVVDEAIDTAIIEDTTVEEVSDTSAFEYLNDLHWTSARDVVRSLESRADVLAAKEVELSRPKPRNAVMAAIEIQLSDD